MTARLPEFGRFAVWGSKPPRLVIADDRLCVTVTQTSRRGAAITAPAPPRSGAATAQTLSRRQRPPPTTDHPPPVADRQPIVAGVCESTQLTISRRMSLRHNAFSCRCEGGDSFARAYTRERGAGESASVVHSLVNNFSCALRKNYLYPLYCLSITSNYLIYLPNYLSTTTTNYLITIANYRKRQARPP
jgi:hypothetical protein